MIFFCKRFIYHKYCLINSYIKKSKNHKITCWSIDRNLIKNLIEVKPINKKWKFYHKINQKQCERIQLYYNIVITQQAWLLQARPQFTRSQLMQNAILRKVLTIIIKYNNNDDRYIRIYFFLKKSGFFLQI